jgi:Transposase DDE domain
LAGRRLVAIDGSCLDVADTAENGAFFGRPGVMKGEKSAFSQARVVALAECGTHAIFDAVVGAYTSSENALAQELIGRLEPGMLLLADRGFYSYGLWRKAIDTGADILWRAKTGSRPEHVQTLEDDSWLALIRPGGHEKAEPITVRVIDYTIDDGRQNSQSYRLFTTILDPGQASATDLAAAYVQRWEIELAFDELKTHQRGPRTVLRSKSPELVLQEIWGHLCCHFAIRSLMADAAQHCGHDPDRVSFVAALRITRQSVAHRSAFPPDDNADMRGWLTFLRRLIARLNPARRPRAAPRVIKRKMPKWHVKRAHHASWPHPLKQPNYTTVRP